MGPRGANGFKRYWHDRRADLPDGDTHRWLVIARPERPPWIARSAAASNPDSADGYSSSWATWTPSSRMLSDRRDRPLTR